jgi:hypothetical protein
MNVAVAWKLGWQNVLKRAPRCRANAQIHMACYNQGSVESERAKLRDEISQKFVSHSVGGHTKLSMFQGAKTILSCSRLPKIA